MSIARGLVAQPGFIDVAIDAIHGNALLTITTILVLRNGGMSG